MEDLTLSWNKKHFSSFLKVFQSPKIVSEIIVRESFSCFFVVTFLCFTSLLGFSYIILFLLSFSFRTNCSGLTQTILQSFIQILKITISFVKKINTNLYNITSVKCNNLWMITSKNRLKRALNIIFKKTVLIASSTLPFTELVFIVVSIPEQQISVFDRNKRDTDLFHSF